jgi:hypothetical protein
MRLSTCCGAETDMEEVGICPECLEHCDWEDLDEDELEADRQTENQIEEEQINKHLN